MIMATLLHASGSSVFHHKPVNCDWYFSNWVTHAKEENLPLVASEYFLETWSLLEALWEPQKGRREKHPRN